jgi:hypothetical protein
MSSKNSKKFPTRRKGDSRAKELKDANIRAQAMAGKPIGEIAQDMGMTRQAIRRTLNSEETKVILDDAKSRLTELVEQAVETVAHAVAERVDLTNALKASISVLKNSGLLKDSVDLNHTFPKPTVIHKRDGSTVILGTTADLKEDEKE